MSCYILEFETVTVLTGIKKNQSKTKQNALAIISFPHQRYYQALFISQKKMFLYKKKNPPPPTRKKTQTTKKYTTIYVEHNKNINNLQCVPEKPVQGQIPSCNPILQGNLVESLRKISHTTQRSE